MSADYSFYVKSIATFAPTFFGYIISVLASVNKNLESFSIPQILKFFFDNNLEKSGSEMKEHEVSVTRING